MFALKEADIAQFYIENGIPLPKNFLELHEERAKLVDTERIIWSEHSYIL